jgi:hypothetical protein
MNILLSNIYSVTMKTTGMSFSFLSVTLKCTFEGELYSIQMLLGSGNPDY